MSPASRRRRRGERRRFLHTRGGLASVAVLAVLVGRSGMLWWGEHGHTVLAVGRWAVPAAVAAGLFLAAQTFRTRRAETRDRVARSRQPINYATVTPADFEQLTGQLLERDGCTDVQVCGRTGDGGIDVRGTTPAGWPLVVQCKRYDTRARIGPDKVRELAAVTAHAGASGLLVTSASFTSGAISEAEQYGIGLVDGLALDAWRLETWSPVAT